MERKFIIIFLSCIMIFNVVAEMRPQRIYADDLTEDGFNYGSYIVSMLMSANVGITDISYLQTIQETFETIGSSALAPQIDQAISDCVNAGVPQQIFEVFSTTAEEATQYVNEVGAENIVNISNEAASAGSNIWASAQNYLQTGIMAASAGGMVFVTEVAPLAVAAAAGVGLGLLINHAREKLSDAIKYGLELKNLSFVQSIPGFNYEKIAYCYSSAYNATLKYYAPLNIHFYYIKQDARGYQAIGVFNSGDEPTYYFQRSNQSVSKYLLDKFKYITSWNGGTIRNRHNFDGEFETATDFEAYCESVKNGTVEIETKTPVSPDIVGTQGNQTSPVDPETGEREPTEISGNYNPQQQTYQPIPWSSILPWAQTANTNTQNGDTGTKQGEDYQELIRPYIIPWPYGDPTSPNPEVSPAPQPTIIPAPSIAPGQEPDPAPTLSPEQEPYTPPQPFLTPVPSNNPDIQSDIEQNLTPDTPTNDPTNDPLGPTVGLKDVFPFCIPWDIYAAFTKFNVAREAPKIEGEIDLGPAGKHEISLDLSVYDNAASLLRTLELLIFIVGLAFVTNYLIGRN